MKLLSDLLVIASRLPEGALVKFCAFVEKYTPVIPQVSTLLYERLEAPDQRRFLVWMLKRWAKLDLTNPVEVGLYLQTVQRLKDEVHPPVELHGVSYRLRDFTSQGHAFKLLGYEWVLGVHDILYNQYEHGDVTLNPGDVIIDAGAFIGDTAVFFLHKLAGRGQVHSFELLDENLALIDYNLKLNGFADGRVCVNRLALTDTTGAEIVIAPGRTQGATSIFGADANGCKVPTMTLDDYVLRKGLTRVDFIKMDIEGAELPALKGALRTIQHFRPRLAICLYHKWDDLATIPAFLQSTGVEYTYGFKWVQLTDGWEAVLLASPGTAAGRAPAVPVSTARSMDADQVLKAMAALSAAYVKKWGQADALWRERNRPAGRPAEVPQPANS